MGTAIRELSVGIDWGTHSSKWWYSAETVQRKVVVPTALPNVVDSTIYRTGDSLFLLKERGRAKRDLADARLKRLLLKDPQGASYWDALREGIGISLGDAATLTIACMLGEVMSSLEAEGLELQQSTAVALRFSLPNWIDSDAEHAAARRRMYQTAVISTALFRTSQRKDLPRLGRHVNPESWHGLVKGLREKADVTSLLNKVPPTFAAMAATDFALDGMTFRLAAESSAAGFPPLRAFLSEIPKNADAQKQWMKLLIVDVGAGSTDIGYLVSSRRVYTTELLMNYLPPARTLDHAGEQLTEMLRDFYYRERRRDLSIEEAETIKLTAPREWAGQQFVKEWRSRIAKAAADYIGNVPDHVRLGEPEIPGLKIVLTGGSGVVSGLDDAIKEEVVDALWRRGVPGNVGARTSVVKFQTRVIPDPVDAARRAVSLGAAQPDFADLAYVESLSRAATKVVAAPKWV